MWKSTAQCNSSYLNETIKWQHFIFIDLAIYIHCNVLLQLKETLFHDCYLFYYAALCRNIEKVHVPAMLKNHIALHSCLFLVIPCMDFSLNTSIKLFKLYLRRYFNLSLCVGCIDILPEVLKPCSLPMQHSHHYHLIVCNMYQCTKQNSWFAWHI